MAITNVAIASQSGGAPGNPEYTDIVTLNLDNSYVTGGYANFNASVAPVIGPNRTIMGVTQNNYPGTTKCEAKYDRTNDKLVCYDAAFAEIANGVDLISVVGLELVITSK